MSGSRARRVVTKFIVVVAVEREVLDHIQPDFLRVRRKRARVEMVDERDQNWIPFAHLPRGMGKQSLQHALPAIRHVDADGAVLVGVLGGERFS